MSQQVRLLEQHLGRVLFHRLPRGLHLAEAGQSYLPLLRGTFERLLDGTRELFGNRSRDGLAVRSSLGFAVYWLVPRLHRFRAAQPNIDLRLTSSIWSPEIPDPDTPVPHHLPGSNPWVREFAEEYGLPYEATRGGAETLYPEYRAVMGPPAKPPPGGAIGQR